MKIINPSTETLIITLSEDTPASIQQKHKSAAVAQKLWASTPLSHRLETIRKFYVALDESALQSTLARTLTQEMGKPLQQSHNEINGARNRIRFFIDNAERWLSEEWMVEEEGLGEKIVYDPLGVVANISAWNYPYLVGVNVFIPALLAGNAVLYKPSEHSTMTGLEIAKLLHESGVPSEIFQVVVGGKEAGEALLALPLDGYFFTGSYRTGKYIYEKVAPKMVPCQLELGGKDPLYVTADNANVNAVAEAAAEGAFYNNGQSCCAVERIYVHKDVYGSFIEAFVAETTTYKQGDPEEEGTFLGPLARKEQVAFLQEQVADALEKGATLQFGGKPGEGTGYHFQPTILTEVNHSMDLMKEESFGPIIGIQKVENDEEAIALMLDTEFGLTASVYADHYETAAPILEAMNSGTVYWNCCDRVSPHVPWSGRQHSGIGLTLSYHGIRAFTQPKAYHLRGERG